MAFRIAWTMAIAFAHGNVRGMCRRTPTAASLIPAMSTWPLHLVSVLAYTLAGPAFCTPTGRVALLLSRSDRVARTKRLLGLALVMCGLIAGVVIVMTITMALPDPLPLVLLLLMAVAFLAIAIGGLLQLLHAPRALVSSLSLMRTPPAKPYWSVQSLARDPSARESALNFARDVLKEFVPAMRQSPSLQRTSDSPRCTNGLASPGE